MARKSKPAGKRLVLHTQASRADLISIFIYNASSYGEAHADAYLTFLHGAIGKLAEDPSAGKSVEDFPGVRVHLVKSVQRKAAFGYRVFFRDIEGGIEVIRVLHVRRDWPEHLRKDQP